MLCYAMLCYAMLCYAMLCYAMLCYAMLCYVMLCYVMLCYVMLCYVLGEPYGKLIRACCYVGWIVGLFYYFVFTLSIQTDMHQQTV